jgi:AcrR family transcriptional regulator
MSAIAAQLGGSKRTLWSYFSSKEELFVAVIEDTTASVRGGIDFSGLGDTPLEQLTNLSRTLIERMVSPIAVQMFRLISSLSDRNPELVRTFFDRGPLRTRVKIADYLRDNFADLLWTDNFIEAGDDLVGFATSHFHFESLWGIASPPTARQREARAPRRDIVPARLWPRSGQTGAGKSLTTNRRAPAGSHGSTIARTDLAGHAAANLRPPVRGSER